jgi:phage tail-like protein
MPGLDLLKSDPLIATNFFLEVDGAVISNLSEVSGLDVELEVASVDQRTKDGQLVQHKIYSKPKWVGELTVKRIAPNDAGSDALWKWFNAIRDKGMTADNRNGERKNGSVVIYDSALKEIARWNFYAGWPNKISNDSVTVGSNEPVSETITFQHEKLERKK